MCNDDNDAGGCVMGCCGDYKYGCEQRRMEGAWAGSMYGDVVGAGEGWGLECGACNARIQHNLEAGQERGKEERCTDMGHGRPPEDAFESVRRCRSRGQEREAGDREAIAAC